MAGMAMGGPMSGGDAVTETMDIPDNAVGLVIGRGGEQISVIQQQSACRVQMAGEGNSGFRTVTLQGQKQCIDKARKMINDVLERSRAGSNGGGGGGFGGHGGMGGGHQNGGSGPHISTELMIPGPKCGLIIGKNGETIKGLQENIGVKMLLIQDSQQVSMGPKPLRITGFPDKVEQAKRVIEQLLSNEDGNAPGGGQMSRPGPRSIGEVIVPRSSVGIIIGKGGETIKRLAQETGAKIQFKPDEDPATPDRCAVIQGTPDQISRATQMISELVTRSAQGSTATEVFYMHVPANKTGLVIGKGGDTIKQICAETGAHVELSRDPPPNPNEKVFVIKGTAYQIHHVQHIIRIKVGDIAPGTPMPQFNGAGASVVPSAGGGGNPFGPSGHQFGGGGADQFQWAAQAQATQNVGQQDSAWTHYYNQQQQQTSGFPGAGAAAPSPYTPMPTQHYQAIPGAAVGVPQMHQQAQPQQHMQQQSAVPQQQQANSAGPTGGTPAINPSTGQPDYSAQWAEYYRTMGMHEQANLIESQMKQQQAAAAQPRPQVYYNS